MDLLSPREAAERLGLTVARVYLFIRTGRLAAERVGRAWVIRAEDLDAVRKRPNGHFRMDWRLPEAHDALLAVKEAAARLGVSRAFVYDLIRRGRLRAQHIGRRRFIEVASLVEYEATRSAVKHTTGNQYTVREALRNAYDAHRTPEPLGCGAVPTCDGRGENDPA